ncbi:ribosome biogenesis protein NOP53-like [Artemia franciscana]|uniref:ribosome biogenesis protein NOP53-like n=1 Tax=Artemia franciscana TaxID=6661 RepID=UPI0032D9BE99
MVNDPGKMMKKTGISKPKKRIVKHSKKAWRVTDIKDVEYYLEDQRLVERLGGSFEEKADQELFIVDTPSEESTPQEKPNEKKKKKRGTSPLRCFKILEPLTAVQDPISKRNTGKPSLPRYLRKKNLAGHKSKLARVPQISSDDDRKAYDIWSDGTPLERQPQVVKINSADLFPQVKRHLLESTCDRVMDRPRHRLDKVSKLPAVEVPDPGQSYNPTFADHQNLMLKAHLIEAEKEEAKAKINRKVEDMIKNVAGLPTEENWMAEMCQGLGDEDDNDADSGIAEEDKDLKLDRGSRDHMKAKTRKQRRKAKLIKMEKNKLKEAKEKVQKEQNIFRVKSIGKEIAAEEKRHKEAAERRAKRKEMKAYQPLFLGPHKFEPQPIEINLSKEISGSLRRVRAEGDLITDRFKSLQKRNIMEPRKLRMPKKVKVKKYERNSHKMSHP